ncbi:MAG: ATP-dependent helicase, partial [Candidatus Atribacteria bacterium]|nr:ATP-dependent helicase [Candidatus Atribacteria bacterium]
MIITGGEEKPLLAEDCQVLAFAGAPQNTEWLDGATAERLLRLIPDMNINSDQASDFVRKVEEGLESLRPHLDKVARQRGEELLDTHQRVRRASKVCNGQYRVEPQLPPDVLGIY